ncbi:MAG: hypothetical protein KIS80_05590 [Anaerolineales bacterium]|nr:hypothetical protein [Anaerolineales bacterium]
MKQKATVLCSIALALFLSACSGSLPSSRHLPRGMPPGIWISRNGDLILVFKDDQRLLVSDLDYAMGGYYELADADIIHVYIGVVPQDMEVLISERGESIVVNGPALGIHEQVFRLLVPDTGPRVLRARDLQGTWISANECNLATLVLTCTEGRRHFHFEDEILTERQYDSATRQYFGGGTPLNFEVLEDRLLFQIGSEDTRSEVFHFGDALLLIGGFDEPLLLLRED